jgi:aminoglycoside phosphotransferase (APT) family kinase protein
MDPFIRLYRNRLNLPEARFERIDHEDAMVATVFKIIQPNGEEFVLKICSRKGDYLREAYFLNHFQGKIPIPRIIQLVPPDADLDGAILMEWLPGHLLKTENLNDNLCYEIGSLLARIHFDSVKGYGDLTEPGQLSSDPRAPFTLKFEEGMDECQDHLPPALLANVRRYYDKHIDLLLEVDGPCIIHRDFRPGNIIINHGKIQGIIDWSSARGGFAEEDFCPLEFGEWSEHLSYKKSFLDGYAKIRKIPDYHRILPLLRLSRAIGAIGFTVKRGTWQGKGSKIYQFNRQYLESFLN